VAAVPSGLSLTPFRRPLRPKPSANVPEPLATGDVPIKRVEPCKSQRVSELSTFSVLGSMQSRPVEGLRSEWAQYGDQWCLCGVTS
jgi:hypothetical protein